MFIAEFVVDHPFLGDALRRLPGLEIEWEKTFSRSDGPTQMLVWITHDDFDAVESAIDADPTVENPEMLIDLGERRLYRVDFTNAGRKTHLMPELFDVGGVLKEAVGKNDGWRCRVLFPDRSALQHIHRFCQAHGIEFEFGRLFEVNRTEAGGPTPLSSLTEGQREAMETACRLGYFEVPRRISLFELAEELGVSDTAASQRLRRAHSTVCEYLLDGPT